MSRDLIRLMHALFLPGVGVTQQAPWHPHTDIYRVPGGWLVKFELAGVRHADVQLQVLGGRMTLRGVRRDCVSLRTPAVHHRMEIAYSHFERALELPCDLKAAEITTEYRDGMLLVLILPAATEEASS